MTSASDPAFAVIPGTQVHQVVDGRETEMVRLVEQAYRLHGSDRTVNPPSYFLTFPDRPNARIIALPASVGGDVGTDGIKWVSSFPDNIATGLPRASAVIILNDPDTGYPIACLEGSIISAVRTAASAALAAEQLSRNRVRPRTLSIIGAGLIARHIHRFLSRNSGQFDEIGIYDLSDTHARSLQDYLERADPTARTRVHDSAEAAIRAAALVVFSTVAATPHVSEPGWFAHAPLVLHVSLRDLAPAVIQSAVNIVDDIEHCLKANTSVHLTEQLTHGRDFLTGTLYDVINGTIRPDPDRTVVFSPFGLGVLDLTVAKHVYDRVVDAGDLRPVDGFFHELHRHA